MFEEIACTFNLRSALHKLSVIHFGHTMQTTHIAIHELGKIDIPDLERDWESEQFCTTLIHLEALLVVLVLLQEGGVIDNDLGVRDAEVQNLIVHSLGRLDCPEGFFEVDVE